MSYKIIPLYLGKFKEFEKSIFTFRTDPGKLIEVPHFSYLVVGDERKILVDTGPPHPDLAPRLTHRKVHDAGSLLSALKKQNLKPEDITEIVLTHLHWDHSYNLELFPNVKIYIQKKELQYAVAPLPSDFVPYGFDRRNGDPPWIKGIFNMVRVDGDYELAPGLDIVFLPGHTPGIQGLNVDTKEGKYLIASDTFPMFENFEKMIPSGIHVNLLEWYASHKKAKKISAHILPGHDMKVLERSVYGEG